VQISYIESVKTRLAMVEALLYKVTALQRIYAGMD